MRNYNVKEVDSYITGSAEEARPHLEKLREVIKSTVPDAEEKISWGIPFYWYHGALVGFSTFKKHVGFGFAFVLPNEERKMLEEKGYKTGIKTVQIKFDQQVPVTEIKHLLLVQANANETLRSRSEQAKRTKK